MYGSLKALNGTLGAQQNNTASTHRTRSLDIQWRFQSLKKIVKDQGIKESEKKTLTATIYTNNRQQRLEHTSQTLTSQHTSCNSEHVHVIACRVTFSPEVAIERTDSHGDGVECLGDDKGETDGVPVGDPVVVFLGDP